MIPETFHLVKLLKRWDTRFKKSSFKEVENYLLYRALHGGIIHVSSSQNLKTGKESGGESLLITRSLKDIGDRISDTANDPEGEILWFEFFFQNNVQAAADVLRLAIEKWRYNKRFVAFHRSKDPEPLSYKIFDNKFCVRYYSNLLRQFYGGKQQSTTNPEPTGLS